jgi:E1A/CREB-binding protein
VDPVALGLPDYAEIIKVPMDLGSVTKRLDALSYRDLHSFVSDVHLTFNNAMMYNPKNSDVYGLAKSLKRDFDVKYRQKVNDFYATLQAMKNNTEACLICGEGRLNFEPPVYYCNGACAQRIRRNSVFYSTSNNLYHWCSPCFNALKENSDIRLPEFTISKPELAKNKKKHIEDSDEGWVQCDGGCERWVHQVCSLFNARRNISDEVSYVCPACIQRKRKECPDLQIITPTTKKMRAFDLPTTNLSQFLEGRIAKRLQVCCCCRCCCCL